MRSFMVFLAVCACTMFTSTADAHPRQYRYRGGSVAYGYLGPIVRFAHGYGHPYYHGISVAGPIHPLYGPTYRVHRYIPVRSSYPMYQPVPYLPPAPEPVILPTPYKTRTIEYR